jgi:hypothetical protein
VAEGGQQLLRQYGLVAENYLDPIHISY